MKKLILTIAAIALVSLPFKTFAQSPTDNLFEKYGAKDGFTTVHVTKELFSLFAEVAQNSEDPDTKELQDVINGLDYIRVLMYDSKDTNNEGPKSDPAVLKEFKAQLNDIQLKNFTELMTVKENNETVKFMIRKEGKNIKELLLLINQKDEAGFISITGNINLKSISKLSKSMNIKGMENLEKIQEPKE
jgi:ribosomal protein L12E/L44/L45/RPP1/RPP2